MLRFSHAQWPQSLAGLDLFSECSARQLRRIGSLLTGLQVPAGEVLMNEGTAGLEFLIIGAGEASVSVGDQVVATLGTGDFVGEMALLERMPRSATVRAITPLTFFVANPAEFATMIDDAPSVRAKILEAAEQRAQANLVAA
jgi:CRP/FNR family cyclic AMP-dependent transcriptional regulator